MQNFIRTIIEEDIQSKKHDQIITRFPPEPNGFLHIGHARAIVTNFELAKLFKGHTNLRFDDTNPSKEDDIYVRGIIRDVKWLGYKPHQTLFASDYFDYMFEKALLLIKKGLAYVDKQNAEEISLTRGDLVNKGIESPYRNTSISENIALFLGMKEGLYKDGEMVLRAKIDMSHPNMNMRDPVIYRILKEKHHRTLDKWVIYPMYDYAHPLEDAYEGITHSLCSLEFEDHRILYDWVVDNCETEHKPRQIEFGRLAIENTIMSKRYLLKLVESKKVDGWNDPRMPTLSGLKRRGFTPRSIRNFIVSTGLSKINSTMSSEMLDSFLREDLVKRVPRLSAVMNPLHLEITNYNLIPEANEVFLNPDNEKLGKREVFFGRDLYIEQDDFCEVKPDKKYKRLSLGNEVRLMGVGYFIKANKVIKDDAGRIIKVLCTYDPLTKTGLNFNERKPDGTISFVEKNHMLEAEFRIYGSLIDPEIKSNNVLECFNTKSLLIYNGYIEKFDKLTTNGFKMQLLRNGYYCVDTTYSRKNRKIVLNQITLLKSSYK